MVMAGRTNPTESSSTSHAWRSEHSTVLVQLSTAAACLSAGSCRFLSSPPWGGWRPAGAAGAAALHPHQKVKPK